jgi:hypothetical protein
MKKIMTAPMTDGQIENVIDKFRAALRKHRDEISSDTAQVVLGIDNLGMVLYAPFRQLAELQSNLIIRRVKVDCSRSAEEALAATGCRQFTNDNVVAEMPNCQDEEVEVVFLKPDLSAKKGWISDDDLEVEFSRRGLRPADPFEAAAVNENDPAFADEHPHGTHWKNAGGQWCFAAFYRWRDEPKLDVYRSGDGWSDDWWFAGVRKKQS